MYFPIICEPLGHVTRSQVDNLKILIIIWSLLSKSFCFYRNKWMLEFTPLHSQLCDQRKSKRDEIHKEQPELRLSFHNKTMPQRQKHALCSHSKNGWLSLSKGHRTSIFMPISSWCFVLEAIWATLSEYFSISMKALTGALSGVVRRIWDDTC